MKSRLCILLSVGLLALEAGPVRLAAGDARPAPWAAVADTSRAFGSPPDSDGPPRVARHHWRTGLRRGALRSPGLDGASPWVGGISSVPVRAQPVLDASRGSNGPELVADPNLWGANGNVLDIARSGNTLYIAGSFRSVGESSGGFVPFDGRTGEALRPFPKVAGSVNTIIPDGAGGWYIGGEFTAVGGKPRLCLARILADGSVSDWNPSVTGSPGYIQPPSVGALTVRGDRVYVGGAFREIGGLPRENLGCVDARTGAVLDWSADTHVDASVYALAVHDSTVFVGGWFSSIGGQPRSCLAAVDAETGAVRAWEADAVVSVHALATRGDTLYVGGEFDWIAGGPRLMLAAINIRTAELLPFDARARGVYVDYVPIPRVAAMALVGDTLYVAGSFSEIGGRALPSLAALNVVTGDALAWTPPSFGPQYDGFPPPPIETLAVNGATLYLGGWFETVGGQSRPFAAALSRETGALTEWNPKPDLTVYALAAQGDTVYAGGLFSLVGEWRHRAGLAAIDLATGAVKPWNPNPNGSIVTALAVGNGRVYASGNFTSIGGDPQPRNYIAALDTINGEVVDWNPGANQIANVFLLEGDTLYAGGEFRQIGGQPRNYLAAISATTGEILPWDPNASWAVFALARSGPTVYAGGLFSRIGGQPRNRIAALDAATGVATSWNPNALSGWVSAILPHGDIVYAGGAFDQVGGEPRRCVAALDAISGRATPWNPQPTPWGAPTNVKALALMDGTLYVGGAFASIGGQPRICLAAVDTSTGLATGWDPGLDGYVWSLATDGTTLYTGGGFTRAGGLPATGLAAFSRSAPPGPAPAPVPFALAQSTPNPARSNAIIRFALSEAAPVTLAVYDLHGRRMVTVLDRARMDAGRHEVPLQTGWWKPGVYLYRIEAGTRSATRKMVVVE